MTVIATDSNRFSNVVKYEFEPSLGYCREVITYNGTAVATPVGTVLGKFIASPTGTATAGGSNTGNGTMGTVTVTSNANLQLGTYTLRIIKAAANAGDFIVTDPAGDVVGYGTVAVAFSQGGLAFTLADGATDFVVGDTFTIVVAGTEKYKLVEATATDGTEVARCVVIADANGDSQVSTPTVNTDTKFLVLARGPAIVSQDAISYGASIDTNGEKTTLYNQLKAVGIIVEDTIAA